MTAVKVWVDLRYVVPEVDVAISRSTSQNYHATAYLRGSTLTVARGPTRLAALIAVLQGMEKIDSLQIREEIWNDFQELFSPKKGAVGW